MSDTALLSETAYTIAFACVCYRPALYLIATLSYILSYINTIDDKILYRRNRPLQQIWYYYIEQNELPLSMHVALCYSFSFFSS